MCFVKAYRLVHFNYIQTHCRSYDSILLAREPICYHYYLSALQRLLLNLLEPSVHCVERIQVINIVNDYDQVDAEERGWWDGKVLELIVI